MVACVEQDKGEDTIQHVNEILSVFLIQVRNDFAVTSGPEGVGGELRPELFVVVDLPVHRDSEGLVFVVEWLVTGGWVDDGEALVGEVAVANLVQPAPVRATVLEPARELKYADSLSLGVVGTSEHCQYAAHFR